MGDEVRIGVALSGGGHRAACWGAGALLGLTDAGLAGDVVSVASVSGGSLANAAVAAEGGYDTASRRRVEAALRDGLGQWAHTGLFFEGPATDRYVAQTFSGVVLALVGTLAALAASIAVAREPSLTACAVVAALALVLGLVLGVWRVGKLRARLPKTSRRKLIGSAAALGPIVFLAQWSVTISTPGWFQAGVVVVWWLDVAFLWRLGVDRFGQRSEVVEAALASTLFGVADGPITLTDLRGRNVHHLFCAANLTTGDHVYMSPRVVSASEVGVGPPHPALTLARAVQSSACLPGAFVARQFSAADLFAEPPADGAEPILLSDGGVYDNMADQWEFGFTRRVKRLAKADPPFDLEKVQPRAEVLVVVNASRAMRPPEPKPGVDPTAVPGALKAEIRSGLGAKDVIYDVSTSLRRRFLVDSFEAGAGGLRGTLVHIDQTPYTTASAFRNEKGKDRRLTDRAHRARTAEAFLERLDQLDGWGPLETPPDERWTEVANRNADVPTTLGSIGGGAAADLLHHAYLLTRLNAFVVCGLGALPAKEDTDEAVLDEWGRRRFKDLVADAAP